jgi:hypothetical protein
LGDQGTDGGGNYNRMKSSWVVIKDIPDDVDSGNFHSVGNAFHLNMAYCLGRLHAQHESLKSIKFNGVGTHQKWAYSLWLMIMIIPYACYAIKHDMYSCDLHLLLACLELANQYSPIFPMYNCML